MTFLLRSMGFGACAIALVAGGCWSEGDAGAGPTGSGGGDGGQAAAGQGGSGAAAPGDCADDGDCQVTQNPCATFACEEGACVPSFPAAGTPVPAADVAGDCQRLVCDGAGSQGSEDDPADIQDDLNPCTVDECTAGAPGHTPVMDATPCGSGQTTACAGGACVGCEKNTECPPGDGCREPVCDESMGGPGKTGTCGLVISAGKEVGNAALDDCMHAICNARGEVVVVGNPEEKPPQDAQACDVEVCDAEGLVAHEPLADGGYCDGGTFCNPSQCLAAVCTILAEPADGTAVPGKGAECSSVVCDGAGMEKTVFVAAGTPCGFGVCDGVGTCVFL
ncbi:MAG: hypothetical protein WKG00_29325 [Polyangiaceae bacterium]